MSEQSTSLLATSREPGHSRDARRLRREGLVLGTVYGGGKDPVSFQIDARTCAHALAHARAVIDLQIDVRPANPWCSRSASVTPSAGDDAHRPAARRPRQADPGSGDVELIDVDELRRQGRAASSRTRSREVTVEAKPTTSPTSIQHSIAGLEIGGTVTLGELKRSAGVTIIGDPDPVIATLSAPRRGMLTRTDGELELETEVVGEGEPRLRPRATPKPPPPTASSSAAAHRCRCCIAASAHRRLVDSRPR